jgi:hypothetical protein
MTILDCVEVWLGSLRGVLESAGAQIRFDRTLDQRPKHACVLNVRQNTTEIDFTVWDSGEGDLSVVENGGTARHEYFDELSDPKALALVLARVATIIRITIA